MAFNCQYDAMRPDPHFVISASSKVYVLCPPGFQTGGTEALHTLAYELRQNSVDALMFYPYNGGYEDPVGQRFKKYAIPYVRDIEDSSENVLIVPEAFPEFLKLYRHVQRGFWWLSVDNCWPWFRNYRPFRDWFTVHVFEIVRWFLLKRHYDVRLLRNGCLDYHDDDIIHLAQSQYAYDFVEKKGVAKVAYLMDYLGDDFLKSSANLNPCKREDIVLYNPSKGYEFTKKIIESAPDIRFVPLVGMKPSEVREWCAKAKVYIDFGNHPGKDRFPREAAIQGVVVVTGRNGSAAFYEDIPIPECYKIDRDDSKIRQIVELIRKVFKEYGACIDDFAEYRAFIAEDHERFKQQVARLFLPHC